MAVHVQDAVGPAGGSEGGGVWVASVRDHVGAEDREVDLLQEGLQQPRHTVVKLVVSEHLRDHKEATASHQGVAGGTARTPGLVLMKEEEPSTVLQLFRFFEQTSCSRFHTLTLSNIDSHLNTVFELTQRLEAAETLSVT